MSDATRYQEAVERSGLSPTHHQVIDWVPRGARVLELGCASGYIGRILRDQKNCTVVGVEVDPAAAAQARAGGMTVHVGSLEDAAFRESIQGPYDVVVAADVLEHLADPGPTLDHMKRWLAPGGTAIVAVPNIATWSMRVKLLRGLWEYEETGILDRTHVHFFTWHTLHRFVREHGFRIEATMADGWEIPGLQTLLVDLPRNALNRLDGFARIENATRREAQKYAFIFIEQFYRLGEAIGTALHRRYPNVSAPHVALLLSVESP